MHHFSLTLAGAELLAASLVAPELPGISRAMVVGMANWSGRSSGNAAAGRSGVQIMTISC